MPAGDITECRYIPYRDQQRYLDEGWELTPLIGPHAHYSVVATRPIQDSTNGPAPISDN